MTNAKRTAEEIAWSVKLKEIREEYGYWDFEDEYSNKNEGKDRPAVDWIALSDAKEGMRKKANSNNYDDAAWAGEIDAADFPTGSWQTDGAYVASFLAQAKALVRRVQTSIYDEYGGMLLQSLSWFCFGSPKTMGLYRAT